LSKSGDLDLSGEWTGVYNYPVAIPPVSFEAAIQDQGGRISGTTSEVGPSAFGSPSKRDAVIDGHREGRSVRFIKMYDRADEEYDVVTYAGSIEAEGDEIGGTWAVAGTSGTFLMVRRSRASEAVERETDERIAS